MAKQGVDERLGGRRFVEHLEVVQHDDGIAWELLETPEQRGLEHPGARPARQHLQGAPSDPGRDPSQREDEPRAEQTRIGISLVEREPSHGALDPVQSRDQQASLAVPGLRREQDETPRETPAQHVE